MGPSASPQDDILKRSGMGMHTGSERLEVGVATGALSGSIPAGAGPTSVVSPSSGDGGASPSLGGRLPLDVVGPALAGCLAEPRDGVETRAAGPRLRGRFVREDWGQPAAGPAPRSPGAAAGMASWAANGALAAPAGEAGGAIVPLPTAPPARAPAWRSTDPPRVGKVSWMSWRISQRIRRRRNQCRWANARSTTQRWLPRREPCSVPRRAIRGFTPRSRTRRRYLSWL